MSDRLESRDSPPGFPRKLPGNTDVQQGLGNKAIEKLGDSLIQELEQSGQPYKASSKKT